MTTKELDTMFNTERSDRNNKLPINPSMMNCCSIGIHDGKKKKKIITKFLSETKILVSNTNVVLLNSTEIITLTLSTQKEKINFSSPKNRTFTKKEEG